MGSCCIKGKPPKEMSILMVDMEQDWPPIGSPFMTRVLNQACQTSMFTHPKLNQSAVSYGDGPSYMDGSGSFLYYDSYDLEQSAKLQSSRPQFVPNDLDFVRQKTRAIYEAHKVQKANAEILNKLFEFAKESTNSQLCLADDDDLLTNGFVVVKSFKEDQREDVKRMIKEAELLRTLHHANIVKFQDFYLSSTGYYRLVGKSDGIPLSEEIKDRNRRSDQSPFRPHFIMKVSRKLADVLSYLHNEKHLLHGNLHSSNVYVNPKSMNVVLAGFEHSLKLNDELESLYPDAKYEGEPLRSPKEVVDGLRITHKSDMYGFGLLIFEMLTLSQPFDDLSPTMGGTGQADQELAMTNLWSKLGTRPPLVRFRYNRSYTDCILLFVNCTNQLAELRPSAIDVCQAFNNPRGFILPTY